MYLYLSVQLLDCKELWSLNKVKLNLLWANWSMEQVLISGISAVLSRRESSTPLGRDTSPSQVKFQQTLGLIYHINIQISAELGIKLETLWLDGRNLTKWTHHARYKTLFRKGVQINSMLLWRMTYSQNVST